MKYFFGLLLIFVILYMFYFPIAYFSYIRDEEADFSELLLSKAVDYAGEAAMAACLGTDDIELDYINSDSMVLSPENASSTFANVMCLSYGLLASEYNIQDILTKVPVMVLAANDGYYIASWQKYGDGMKLDDDMKLVWQPKKAYVIDTNPDDRNNGILYGVELSMRKVNILNKQTLSLSTNDNYDGLPFNKEMMIQNVNRCINKDVNAVLARYAIEWKKDSVQSFYLPFSAGTVGVNRVEKPSLIVVMRDIDIDGIRPRNVSTVNGMKVTQKIIIVGWTSGNGVKYYCQSGYIDSAAQGWIEQNGVIFYSAEEAAKEGYLPY